MKRRLYLYIIVGIFFLLVSAANSKDVEKPLPHTHEAMQAMNADNKTEAKQSVPHAHETMKVLDSNKEIVDVAEKLGETIPLDIELVDESNTRHQLKNIIEKPTILALVYYYCPMACSLIQGNLANALNEVPLKLGQDYQVLSVSFDHEETPEDARQAKTNYLKIIKAEPDPNAWRFFTASPANIERITAAVGFQFIKTGPHQFIHPNLVTVVAADGQIIRYLYGTRYLPFDIGMAVSEALQGTPGVSIKKILSYCFEYDPQKNRYAFKLVRVFGFVTLILVAGFIFFLLRKDKGKT